MSNENQGDAGSTHDELYAYQESQGPYPDAVDNPDDMSKMKNIYMEDSLNLIFKHWDTPTEIDYKHDFGNFHKVIGETEDQGEPGAPSRLSLVPKPKQLRKAPKIVDSEKENRDPVALILAIACGMAVPTAPLKSIVCCNCGGTSQLRSIVKALAENVAAVTIEPKVMEEAKVAAEAKLVEVKEGLSQVLIENQELKDKNQRLRDTKHDQDLKTVAMTNDLQRASHALMAFRMKGREVVELLDECKRACLGMPYI